MLRITLIYDDSLITSYSEKNIKQPKSARARALAGPSTAVASRS